MRIRSRVQRLEVKTRQFDKALNAEIASYEQTLSQRPGGAEFFARLAAAVAARDETAVQEAERDFERRLSEAQGQ